MFAPSRVQKALWDKAFQRMKKTLTLVSRLAFYYGRAEGLEPSTKVLETHVLPLHHAPMRFVRDCRNEI